ncbi:MULTISPECIES: mannitol-1-phosphate 5-dehydrogenase [Paenibacillus]|uniref:mannitol-1-phosphate 5-dehydrogenase n=1 Tax=Paenibacillus TaxID=44249 RepID=UPI0022B8D5A2|nr:mannitol-1-phosphate 5-dehydrogenase [Paenibacillus caseinilyticus]MCZ8522300.1 mannitol-1-phosphate 5-dehydrogenase [Paenibacillus caseinilyticus]
MKAVHFGAGNIGRGFIGLLLFQSGYEVCFVDVNETLVSELQRRGAYTVALASDAQESYQVRGVTALPGGDLDRVAEAVAGADLVTTAVGVNILKSIAVGIAKGVKLRLQAGGGPQHLIACENAIGGSAQLKEHVYSYLSEEERRQAEGRLAFPNAAVDRIVPVQRHEDPLHVTVEPFYEWVVDGSQMLPGLPQIQGVHYAGSLGPYIERKLFTVNAGHCCAAYMGFLYGKATIQESMADERIAGEVRGLLGETGRLLTAKYGFDAEEHQAYIGKTMERFRNPHLTDEVARVGRSPVRKLSPNDRLVRPALGLQAMGVRPVHLARAMAAALRFRAEDDPDVRLIEAEIGEHGLSAAIRRFTSLEEDHPVHALILEQYEELGGQLA